MTLYIKQHVFTWGDRFSIYDEGGREQFFVEGEIFSFGKKLHLLSLDGRELAFIHQKVFSFLPRYYVNCRGREIAEIVRHFSFFSQEYSVNGLGWEVIGDFFAHEFEVHGGGRTIARVYKEWFTWGDTYAIEIATGIDEIAALSVVLALDAIISADRN
ncbi:MAG: LURP-one-related family protein [Clostridia bacterium]|nr:LURP-one-related family protein [Clostridia bacterium]